jgi:hypothetical protein
MPDKLSCVVPDIDKDGVIQVLSLQRVDVSDTACKALPPGFKLTRTQGVIVDSFT